MRSLHTSLYRQAKSLARGKLGEAERVFMMIRSGALTDEMVYKIVANYISSRLEGAVDGMGAKMDEHGENYKAHRGTLLKHFGEEKATATEIVLDRGGLVELGPTVFGREAMDDRQLKRIADKLLAEILGNTEKSRQQNVEALELSPDQWPEGYDFGNGMSYAGLSALDASLSRQRTPEGLDDAAKALQCRVNELRQELKLGS